MKRITTLLALMCVCMAGFSQKEWERKWGIEANLSGGSFYENKTFLNEDEYNSYSITADYFLTPRFALSGGMYLEQDGIMTTYSDGIGMKSIYMFGPEIGAKYYFFPKKWVVQPYIGAMIMTNILNLGHKEGGFTYTGDGYDCSNATVYYDVQCPVATISPKLGVDVRLTKNIILTANMDYRIGLYGHNRSQVQIFEGYHAGKTCNIDESMVRNGFSLGVKIDLPWYSKNNSKIGNYLIDMLQILIRSNAH